MFFFYAGNSISRTLPLSDIISGVVFDVDATIANSYSGSGQMWSNLVPTPSDGSSQATYNFTLGTSTTPSTDDPTFNGSANSPAAYWGFDGGDFFEIEGTNTTFLNALHRTDVTQPFTIGVVLRNAADATTSWLMSTNDAFAWSASNRGFSFAQIPGSSSGGYAQVGDTATVSAGFAGATANTDVFLIFSYDPATTTLRRWINTTTKSTSVLTKNACVTNAIQPLRLGGRGGVYNASGIRLYNTFMTNTYIDDADVVSIINQLQVRHQRGYVAPVNTVAPVISGGTTVDSVLTSTTGTWTGAYITYTYQWQRNGSNIGGATSSTYTVVSADAGTNITCSVTATNARAVSATSNTIAITAVVTRSTPLSATVASCVFDLDATIGTSYTSGQTWANLVTAPADGKTQTAYDWFLGDGSPSSTDDPTFTGTADDPAAYFLHDGGDLFNSVSTDGTLFHRIIHQNGTAFTLVAALRSTVGAAGLTRLITTGFNTGNQGLYMVLQAPSTNLELVFNQSGAVSSTGNVIVDLTATLGITKATFEAGMNLLIAVSYDPGTGLITVRTPAGKTTQAITFQTAVLASALRILSNMPPSGVRTYAFSMFNTLISDADFTALKARYDARHGRTY